MTPPAWEEGGESGFLLGTDNLGRDILSRIIAGARVSVVIAAYAILLSGGIGAALGMIAGYFGGVPDSIISRLIDVQMSVPSLPLALLFASVLPPGEGMVILVIVMTYWTWYARIVRGEVLSLRERDFIALAKVAGVSTPIIFIRHLTPNILNTMLVLVGLTQLYTGYLGYGIWLIGGFEGACQQRILIDWLLCKFWINTGTPQKQNLLATSHEGAVDQVAFHHQIFIDEVCWVGAVGMYATNFCCC